MVTSLEMNNTALAIHVRRPGDPNIKTGKPVGCDFFSNIYIRSTIFLLNGMSFALYTLMTMLTVSIPHTICFQAVTGAGYTGVTQSAEHRNRPVFGYQSFNNMNYRGNKGGKS